MSLFAKPVAKCNINRNSVLKSAAGIIHTSYVTLVVFDRDKLIM